MKTRQEQLLKTITACYIKSAQPVSSKLICQEGDFDLSSATIRNEMAELEDDGYIYHPHTSSGRVPTEKGYRYYVEHFIGDEPLAKRHYDSLEGVSLDMQDADSLKQVAKKLSELANNAAFIAFSPNDFYYTGISNLFGQPEFTQHEVVYNISRVIDHFDGVLAKLFDRVQDAEILIGKENPFAQDCSAVVTRYGSAGRTGLLGILGPVRMDYQQNYGLVRFSKNLINNAR